MKKFGVLLLGAAFVVAGCQSEEEKAAAEAAREARAAFERSEIEAARPQIEAMEARFDWNVRRRYVSNGVTRKRCNVTDLQDGSKYRVGPSGARLQSGPGNYVDEEGGLFRSGSRCIAFNNVTQIYCETRTNDVPVCKPYSLMPERYQRKIGL